MAVVGGGLGGLITAIAVRRSMPGASVKVISTICHGGRGFSGASLCVLAVTLHVDAASLQGRLCSTVWHADASLHRQLAEHTIR